MCIDVKYYFVCFFRIFSRLTDNSNGILNIKDLFETFKFEAIESGYNMDKTIGINIFSTLLTNLHWQPNAKKIKYKLDTKYSGICLKPLEPLCLISNYNQGIEYIDHLLDQFKFTTPLDAAFLASRFFCVHCDYYQRYHECRCLQRCRDNHSLAF